MLTGKFIRLNGKQIVRLTTGEQVVLIAEDPTLRGKQFRTWRTYYNSIDKRTRNMNRALDPIKEFLSKLPGLRLFCHQPADDLPIVLDQLGRNHCHISILAAGRPP